MTSEVILYLMKNLHLHNVNNHRFFFYQNHFLNEYATKKKTKIPESCSFLVRYKRSYVLNKIGELRFAIFFLYKFIPFQYSFLYSYCRKGIDLNLFAYFFIYGFPTIALQHISSSSIKDAKTDKS